MSLPKLLASRSLRIFRFIRPVTKKRTIMTLSRPPTILPADVRIEEELIPDYNPKSFYPVHPGDLLHDRYRVVAKVGWGTTSTVWLALDTRPSWSQWWQSKRYVALKIAVSDYNDKGTVRHELNITRRLDTDPSHPGFPFVRTTRDNFELTGSNGAHLCLVHEPMRESLWIFQKRFKDGKLPPAVLKVYVKVLLLGLDYLHSVCHTIHTDLKAVNILVGFEDPSVIQTLVRDQAKNPMPRKIKDGRVIYQSYTDFGQPKRWRMLPMIADFGLAQAGDSPEPLTYPTQPPLFRAPEVLLGTSWTYSADIWNFGIWNLLEGNDLFRHIISSENTYDVRAHLAEMIALFGPPPKILLDRERRWSKVKWSHAFLNLEGKLCQTAREYYGGPFFDSEGEFMHKNLIPNDISLENSVLSLEGEDKRLFLDFVKKIFQWLPEERQTAKELAEHPWLA